jgi:predicted O-methyltransferase YrrM
MNFTDLIIQRFDAEVPAMAMPQGVAGLKASNHPFARLMGDVVEEVIVNQVNDDERPHVDAIEARRAELEASEDDISYMDFGAATRDGDQTPEEMYEGVARERTVGHLCRRTSKPYRSALMLHKLVRRAGSKSCLELGTCLGISASYQAAALELNGAGRIITMEGAAPVAALAQQTVDRLGHGRVNIVVGRFQDTLDDTLAQHQPFDYAFIDGHHDGPATVVYYNAILPKLADGAIVVYDDIRWSNGMLDAWNELKQHENVEVSVDLVDIGICWVRNTPGTPEHHVVE